MSTSTRKTKVCITYIHLIFADENHKVPTLKELYDEMLSRADSETRTPEALGARTALLKEGIYLQEIQYVKHSPRGIEG